MFGSSVDFCQQSTIGIIDQIICNQGKYIQVITNTSYITTIHFIPFIIENVKKVYQNSNQLQTNYLNLVTENLQNKESEHDQQTSNYEYKIEQFKAEVHTQEKENQGLKNAMKEEQNKLQSLKDKTKENISQILANPVSHSELQERLYQ